AKTIAAYDAEMKTDGRSSGPILGSRRTGQKLTGNFLVRFGIPSEKEIFVFLVTVLQWKARGIRNRPAPQQRLALAGSIGHTIRQTLFAGVGDLPPARVSFLLLLIIAEMHRVSFLPSQLDPLVLEGPLVAFELDREAFVCWRSGRRRRLAFERPIFQIGLELR